MKCPFGHHGVSKLTVFVSVIFLVLTFVSCGARNDPLNPSGAVWDEIIRYDIGPIDESVDSMPNAETESPPEETPAPEPDSVSQPRETTSSPPETSPSPDEVETTGKPETSHQPVSETAAPPAVETRPETVTSSADTYSETTAVPEKASRETVSETTLDRNDKVSHTVYWVKSGKVWHTTKDCPSLSRSKSILSGSVDDAMAAGKERVCKRCGG